MSRFKSFLREEGLYRIFYYGTMVLVAAIINDEFSEYGLAWVVTGCIVMLAYLMADKYKEMGSEPEDF